MNSEDKLRRSRTLKDQLRYQTVQLLAGNEKRFREMIDALPAAVYITDAEGRLIHFNPACVDLAGRTPVPGVDRWCVTWKLESPDGTFLPHDQSPMAIAIKENHPITGAEAIAVRPDGRRIWFTAYPTPLRDDNGELIGAINMLVDITEYKKVETASRWQASIVESTDDAIISKTLDGIITSWNHSAEKMFGYAARETIGRHITLIVPPVLHAEEEDILARLGKGEKIDHFETIRQHKDGRKINVSLTISPIKDNTGRVIGASKIARDITGQKQASKALSESEERLRITLDATEMGTWDWDIVSDKTIWNRQQYLLLGLDPEKEKDTPKNLAYFLQFVYSKDAKKAREKIKTAAEENNVNDYKDEFRIIRASDGQRRWMNRYGRKIKDENGRFTHIVGVMYDITERKLVERLKDEFIGIASHELKTPVTSIKMYVELILQILKEKEGSQSVEMMQRLDRQVDRLVELINDLLDTTRIDEGKLSLNFTQFDVNELIEECKEAFQSSKTHKIIFQAGKLDLIIADRERIGQVITNLISNAIKYSPGSKEVNIVSEQIENGVKVSVRDTGIGISDELLPKIFNRFSRLNHSQTFPGIGLGLYISAEIIRRHGGAISVESPPTLKLWSPVRLRHSWLQRRSTAKASGDGSRTSPQAPKESSKTEQSGEAGKGSLFYFTLPYNHREDQKKPILNETSYSS